MISFRGVTFCGFNSECNKGGNCALAYTDDIAAQAKEWWGNEDAPVCLFADKPGCFEEIEGGG